MPHRHSRGHRDDNEAEITLFLRRANVRYFLLPEGAGADILLYIKPMAFVEVKNPKQVPSAQQLTEIEADTKAYCEDMGIPYHIVKSPEEMAMIINRWIEETNHVR